MTEFRENYEIADEQRTNAVENRENFERNIGNMWGHSDLGIQAKRAAMTMLSTKTGMYAKIPITCKAETCPYADSCQLLAYDLAPFGEFCPVETAEIELRYEAYSQDFDLESASFTDKCLVSEIINADIMMERCKALMAKEGVPVIEVVAGISENGEEIMRPEVSKFWDAYERASKKRNDAYQLMQATRKDKRGLEVSTGSITEIIAEAVINDDFLKIDQRPEHLTD